MVKIITEDDQLLCVRYGADEYRPELVKPVKNSETGWMKPQAGTGLWLCPVDSKYDWKRWCREENFQYDFSLQFYVQFVPGAKVIVIDSHEDLKILPKAKNKIGFREYPDFEKIAASGFHAMWLTAAGEIATRWSEPETLYGWDCESVLLFDSSKVFEITKPVKRNVYRKRIR